MFKQQQQQKILQTHFSVDMDEYFQTSANFTGSNNLCLENYIAVYPLFWNVADTSNVLNTLDNVQKRQRETSKTWKLFKC